MAVYIFENPKAERVKVGKTVNNVRDRLEGVNREWHKITCQVCGGRLWRNTEGHISEHKWRGDYCAGANALPLEEDSTLAKSYLKDLKKSISNLSGSEKGSMTRIANNLEKRIEKYQGYSGIVGKWYLGVVYYISNKNYTKYTKGGVGVEALSHEILDDHLDEMAPIGEVFCCSLSVASEAVENALSQLGLLETCEKEDYSFYY